MTEDSSFWTFYVTYVVYLVCVHRHSSWRGIKWLAVNVNGAWLQPQHSHQRAHSEITNWHDCNHNISSISVVWWHITSINSITNHIHQLQSYNSFHINATTHNNTSYNSSFFILQCFLLFRVLNVADAWGFISGLSPCTVISSTTFLSLS